MVEVECFCINGDGYGMLDLEIGERDSGVEGRSLPSGLVGRRDCLGL